MCLWSAGRGTCHDVARSTLNVVTLDPAALCYFLFLFRFCCSYQRAITEKGRRAELIEDFFGRVCFVHRELEREKIWSRIHLVPLLTAEGDRDAYRRHQAAVAREREIMKDVPGWEVGGCDSDSGKFKGGDTKRGTAGGQKRIPQSKVRTAGYHDSLSSRRIEPVCPETCRRANDNEPVLWVRDS